MWIQLLVLNKIPKNKNKGRIRERCLHLFLQKLQLLRVRPAWKDYCLRLLCEFHPRELRRNTLCISITKRKRLVCYSNDLKMKLRIMAKVYLFEGFGTLERGAPGVADGAKPTASRLRRRLRRCFRRHISTVGAAWFCILKVFKSPIYSPFSKKPSNNS